MEYLCKLSEGTWKEKWTGELRVIKGSRIYQEAEINGRGTYFHIIAGAHKYGNYICIPNHNVGSELSDYDDLFWNTERLSGFLRKVDAATVAYGLCCLKDWIPRI